jgi:hypothetical protein
MDSDRRPPVPATKIRQTDPATTELAPSAAGVTAARLFKTLEPLHGLPSEDMDLLQRAAAGLRFIRSTGSYTELEHQLFRIALAELGTADAAAVESAACWAADLVPYEEPGGRSAAGHSRERALWFAAVLRISDAFCTRAHEAPEAVFATWTDTVLYLEFDGRHVSQACLADAKTRAAALEALTGRDVLVGSSAARRGAA